MTTFTVKAVTDDFQVIFERDDGGADVSLALPVRQNGKLITNLALVRERITAQLQGILNQEFFAARVQAQNDIDQVRTFLIGKGVTLTGGMPDVDVEFRLRRIQV